MKKSDKCDKDCKCGCREGKECTCGCGDKDCTCGCREGKECTCGCGDKDCTCGCREGKECTCGCGDKDCKCGCREGKECTCGCGDKDCKCGCREGKECTCGCGCRKGKKIVGAAMLSLGLVLAGFFPGYYYYHAKMDANSVVVKGLAEMDVKADLAIWNIKFVVTGDDVIKAQQDMEQQKNTVRNFLLKNNIKAEEISIGRLETNDLMASPYRSANDNGARFILTQNITVKSTDVDNIAAVLNKSGDLVAQGVIFNQDYGYPVSYLFTGLNDIKPQMLAEATKNAKEAAAEFAKNSGSKVGKIRHANQGVFSILPREQSAYASEMQEIEKKVRVVSTIEYWLE